MTELGSRERKLIEALRKADQPTEEDEARVYRRVAAQVGLGVGVAATMTGVSAHAGASAGSGALAAKVTSFSLAWKTAVSVAALTAAGGVAYWEFQPPAEVKTTQLPETSESAVKQPPPKTRSVPAPSASTVPEPEAPPNEAEDVEPEPTKKRAPKPPVRASAKAPVRADLEAEIQLLRSAQSALNQGDTARAQALLREHAKKYPNGALAAERSAVMAIALCKSGQTAQGRALALRVLGKRAKSLMARRLRTACDIQEPD